MGERIGNDTSPKAFLNTANLANSLSWSAGTSRLGETPRPNVSSKGRLVTIHCSGCHSPLLGYGSATAHSIPPSHVLISASVFHTSHRGLGRVFPGPRQVILAVADVSRHIWQEGSLGNTSCLLGRLQDKVPQALPTLQH